MATPVRQGAYSGGRCTGGSPCSGAAYLYAELQHAGARNPGASAQPVPHTPRTPRALTQTQQRNAVRQWMGLAPVESNWQRAGRQVGQAAGRLARTVAQSLGQAAGLAGTAWEGMRGAGSFIAGLADFQVGPAAAAAQAPASISPPAVPRLGFLDCLLAADAWMQWEASGPAITTVEQLLAACPAVECNDHARGSLQGVTVVIEGAAQLSLLAIRLAERGAKVFLSAGAMDEIGAANCELKPLNCRALWFYRNYSRLDDAAPDDWSPAPGGSVVLLSRQEFAEQRQALRSVGYPSCIADAHACPPAPPPDAVG